MEQEKVEQVQPPCSNKEMHVDNQDEIAYGEASKLKQQNQHSNRVGALE